MAGAVWRGALVAVALVLVVEILAKWLRPVPWANPTSRLPLWQPVAEHLAQPLLLGLAQIAGLLLGLFFASVAVVASTAYADAPEDARSLFFWERGTRVFAQSVASLLVVTLSFLTLQFLGHPVSTFALLAVTGYAGFLVLALVAIAPRTYAFFDPIETARPLVGRLERWFTLATSAGRWWTDSRFQNHYRQQARSVLDKLDSVINYSIQRGKTDPAKIANLGSQLLSLWTKYSKAKTAIPRDSRWFERIYSHPQWLLAEEFRTGIALGTRTPLSPEETPDHLWIERRLAASFATTLKSTLDSLDLGSAIQLVAAVGHVAKQLLQRLQVEEYRVLWSAVTVQVWDFLARHDDTSGHSDGVRREVLALADAWGSIPVQAELGLQAYTEALAPVSFEPAVTGALQTPKGIYDIEASPSVLRRLERLAADRRIEIAVEGRPITPAWFASQMTAREAAKEVDAATTTLLSLLGEDVRKRAEEMAAAKPQVSAMLISRGLEACHKLEVHLPGISERLVALATLQRTPDDQWPDKPYDRHSDLVKREYRGFIDVALSILQRPEAFPIGSDLPDSFGQCHALVADETFNAILTGDEELFGRYFASLLLAADVVRERAEAAIDATSSRARIIAGAEAWLLVFELSGYALLVGEIDGSKNWATCASVWDRILGSMTGARGFVAWIAASLRYRASIFGLFPGDLSRTSRRQRFDRVMRARGFLPQGIPGWHARRASGESHASPIARLFLRGLGFDKPEDLFLSEYLFRRPEAAGLEAPRGVERIGEQLSRERARDNSPGLEDE